MLWQVWIILHSWIFCWLLPVDCSTICLYLGMKQSQSFSQDQTFYCLPSAPSCCLHVSDTSLSKHFKFQVVQWLEFLSVLSEHHSQSWLCLSPKALRDVDVCPCCSGVVLACGGAGHGHWCSVAMRESGVWLRLLGQWFSAVGMEMLAGRGNACVLSGETLKMPMCCQSVSSLPRVWWTNPKPGLN